MNLIEYLVQYGIAGIALYMMYTITYNHLDTMNAILKINSVMLTNIEHTLSKILEELKERAE